MRVNLFQKLSELMIMLVFMQTSLFAQDVTLSLDVAQKEISIQESIYANLTLSGNFSTTPPIQDINWEEQGWSVSSRSQSTSMSIVNGQRDITISYRYRIKPLKAGVLKLGPFTSQVNGVQIQSNELSITVNEGAPKVAPAERGVNQIAFMRWEIDESELYLGQAVTAKLMVYVNQQIRLTYFKPSEINLEGFWTQTLDDPNTRSPYVRINGMNYQQQEAASYILFPLKEGELALPQIQAEMRISTMSFFAEENDITRIAESKPIKVKPLPENPPKTFKGLTVGKVTLQAAVDRNRLNADESFQYTLTTQIEGLLANTPPFEMPDIEGFKIFPPSEKTQTRIQNQKLISVRQQVWLIKPSKGGNLKFPPIEISYFDPKTAQYQTAVTRNFDIEVAGTPVAQTANTVAQKSTSQNSASEDQAKNTITTAFKSIKTQLSAPVTPKEHSRLLSLIIALLGPLFLLGSLVTQRINQWHEKNPHLKKSKNAYKNALEKLNLYESQGESNADKISVSAILFQYLEDKYQSKLKGSTYDKFHDILAPFLSKDLITCVIQMVEAEDFRRYSSEKVSNDLLLKQSQELKALLNKIEGAK